MMTGKKDQRGGKTPERPRRAEPRALGGRSPSGVASSGGSGNAAARAEPSRSEDDESLSGAADLAGAERGSTYSEPMLDEPDDDERDAAERTAIDEAAEEGTSEPAGGDVDLLSNAIRAGSLFDQPTERGTRTPNVRSDENVHDESPAREGALRESRRVLSHGRSRAEKSSRK